MTNVEVPRLCVFLLLPAWGLRSYALSSGTICPLSQHLNGNCMDR